MYFNVNNVKFSNEAWLIKGIHLGNIQKLIDEHRPGHVIKKLLMCHSEDGLYSGSPISNIDYPLSKLTYLIGDVKGYEHIQDTNNFFVFNPQEEDEYLELLQVKKGNFDFDFEYFDADFGPNSCTVMFNAVDKEAPIFIYMFEDFGLESVLILFTGQKKDKIVFPYKRKGNKYFEPFYDNE